MYSAEQARDVPMRMAGVGSGAGNEPGQAEFVERRQAVTPLRFEAVERRRANLEQAGVDLVQEAARAQDAAALEALRAQLRGVPAQIEAARAEGHAAAVAEMQAGLQTAIDMERETVIRACAQVSAERDQYFTEIEGEVVRLALAVAARVLHRESKMDPMLLAASVRLALEKVAGETGTVLRVPLAAVDLWRGLVGEDRERAVQVVGDERMAAGDCVVETNVGRVELGVAVQLEEIEKGFFDLLQKRPA